MTHSTGFGCFLLLLIALAVMGIVGAVITFGVWG